jgi:hypothetical protein
MSAPEDAVDEAVRRLLASYPRPELPATFSRNVVANVLRAEEARPKSMAIGPRLVLLGYWLAALVASGFILVRVPWPAWLLAVAAGLALGLTPLACAYVLFPKRTRGWVALSLSPLLPRLDR